MGMYYLQKAKLHYQTASTLFQKNPTFSSLFKKVDLTSDYEENTSDPTLPPTRIIPAWRSNCLTELIDLLDHATVQLAKSSKQQIALLHFFR